MDHPCPVRPSGVADLPAGFGVERSFLQHELHVLALLTEGEDIGLSFGRLVADEVLLALLEHSPTSTLPNVSGFR